MKEKNKSKREGKKKNFESNILIKRKKRTRELSSIMFTLYILGPLVLLKKKLEY